MLDSRNFRGITLLIAGLLGSSPALAGPCKPIADSMFGFEIEKHARQEREDKKSNLVFVFVDETNRKVVATESVGLTADQSHVGIDPKALSHVKKGISLRVYNFSPYGAMIIDRADDSMKKDFDPSADCPKASRLGRTIGSAPGSSYACDAIDLAGVAAATVIYDQAASACEKFARYANQELTAAQKGELKVAARSITHSFGSPNRSLAIDEDATEVAKSKTQAIGTSKNINTKRGLKRLEPARTSTNVRKSGSSVTGGG